MGKYQPLGEFLRSQRTQEVPLTFREIERITGAKLPPKAQHHRAWWSNNANNNVMTKVWLDAGYESAQVDVSARKLVFRKRGSVSQQRPPLTPDDEANRIARHPLRGLLKDVTHIPPGVDLTEPADPDWAKLRDENYGPDVR
jgi:hypothetical protein